MGYMPKGIHSLTTAVKLLIPTGTTKVNGVTRYQYPTDGDVIFCNWKSYGGTEQTVNGVYSVIDTAHITTRFRPDITGNTRLLREDGAVYEIISPPDNTEMNNKFLEFKVRRVKGGA